MNSQKIKMFLIFMLCISSTFKTLHCNNEYPQCHYVGNQVFQNCLRKVDPPHVHTNIGICNHSFTMSAVRKQMFFYTLQYALEDMIYYCCGNSTQLERIRRFNYEMDVNEETIQDSDFVYPIMTRYKQEQLHGYYFVPVYDLPQAYYVTQMKSTEKLVLHIAETCFDLWPLLLLCILAAIIAGFLIWGMETRTNAAEFPQRFHLGLFEGLWWAFTSMTTVGYGDITPRSVAGRLFAICWIFVGITICSIFNAALTSEIIHVRDDPAKDIKNLQGKTVGCLNYRLNDAIFAAQHGGIVKTIEYNNTWVGIGRLIEMINEKTIDGFLVSTQTYYDFLAQIKKPKYEKVATIVRQVDLLTTNIENKQERLAYGFLVKHKHHYEYFRRYFKNNWLHLQTCNQVKNNRKYSAMSKFKFDIFSHRSGIFSPFLNGCLGILAVIFTIGLLYELKNFMMKKKVYSIKEADDSYNKTSIKEVNTSYENVK